MAWPREISALPVKAKNKMDITIKAKLLTAESNQYKFDGKEGVSHKVRLLVNGEIFSLKSDSEQVAGLKDLKGLEGEAVLRFESRKENLTAKLVSFEA